MCTMCTVALIHDDTSKININLFSKTFYILFSIQISKASKPALQVSHHSNVMQLTESRFLHQTRPSPWPGKDYLLCSGCSIVQQTLGILFHMWSAAGVPLSRQAGLSRRVTGRTDSKPQIFRLMSPSRGRIATDFHSAFGPKL